MSKSSVPESASSTSSLTWLRQLLLDRAVIYRAWQAPFAGVKLEPVSRHNDMRRVRRVLDLGCGPAINTALFLDKDYVGIDINPRYIDYARRRFDKTFIAADLTTYEAPGSFRFDFVLLNSFLHHVDDSGADRILSESGRFVSSDGHIHILDMVKPEQGRIARKLCSWDRGAYFRSVSEWRGMFGRYFREVVLDPFSISIPGLDLWYMIYFKGKPKI